MNGVVSILALMGIAVAASELPLAFRKRETLLGKQSIYGAWNVTKLLRYHENGRSFCKSKATSRSSCLAISSYVLHYLRVSTNNVYVLFNQSFRILFNYLNEYLHDVQKDNFELGKGNINVFVEKQHGLIKRWNSRKCNCISGKYSSLMLVLLGFYFLEFCLFTITAVANRAIIVAFFNSQVRAITEEQERLRIIIILSDVDNQFFDVGDRQFLSPMK